MSVMSLTFSSPWQRLFRGTLAAAILVSSFALSTNAQVPPPKEPVGYTNTPVLPNQIWRVHDKYRPRPPLVLAPEQPSAPPSDAVVLFDGKNLDAWTVGQKDGKFLPAPWKVENGYVECVPNSGSIFTREQFGDCQLHLEFATPEKVEGSSQGRGNSGVIIMGRYEIQVLDSFENDTYPDGQVGAIYGQFPPLVNVARGPGKWQSYDIIFEAPRFDGKKLVKPARATVFHNGVLLHHAQELIGPMAHQEIRPYEPHEPVGPLLLQDHGNKTRFRNIWYRSLEKEKTPWITFEGKEGPGAGKHVVLVSGDEEYRSEEALTQLARILAERHGFRCTVLYAINPKTGTIDPNYSYNIPGLHMLENADLLVLFTRFRELPDWQMKHVIDYVEAGKPVIGLRTSTHGFRFGANSAYAEYSWDSKKFEGGFGQQILGDTWVAHHGNHGSESTRGVIEQANAADPILLGVKDVWGPTDVYSITHLSKDAKILLRGQILKGMKQTDEPVADNRNSPMMPLAWTKSYTAKSGKVCKVFNTTLGASVDLQNEGVRRLLVNASYWAVGLEGKIKPDSDVGIVGNYAPTFFGFHNEPDYWTKKKLTPADFAK